MAFSDRYDVVALHDPELLPLGMVLTLLRRTRVVFDVHEDIPAQMLGKEWLPPALRAPVALAMRVMLRLAETMFELTLAEDSYGRVLRRAHPVIRNYPEVGNLPHASDRGSGAVYVGDVTVARGVLEAVEACGRVGLGLVLVGPVSGDTERLIRRTAHHHDADVEITGRLPHREAMERVAAASVALSPLRDLPNYRESIPTKVLEYLAVGVPVAASDLPATRRLVAGLDAVALHPPGDVPGLMRAIEASTRPEMSGVARAQASAVRRRFRWPGADLVEVYDRISG